MTEIDWEIAEQRQPGKTYIEPEMLPFWKDRNGRRAGWCLVLAAIVALFWLFSANPAFAACCVSSYGFGRTDPGPGDRSQREDMQGSEHPFGNQKPQQTCGSCHGNDSSGSQRGGQGSNGNQGWDR